MAQYLRFGGASDIPEPQPAGVSYSYEVLIPPAENLLVGLARVKRELGIAANDTAQDERLRDLIADASDAVTGYCNRKTFARRKIRQTFRGGPRICGPLYLADDLVADVVGVAANGTALEPGTFTVGPGPDRLELTGGARVWGAELAVEYFAGFVLPSDEDDAPAPTLPRAISRAALDLVGALYARPIARDPTLRSDTTEGVGTLTYTTGDKPQQLLTAEAYPALDRYRRRNGP